jgi:iron complex outermembrane receptor protein
MLNELVAGVDVNDWKRKTTSDFRWPTPARNRRPSTCATNCASTGPRRPRLGAGRAPRDLRQGLHRSRVFRHNLTNEIFYDPTIFTNTNLAPTRREGFELDAEQRIGADWNVSAHYQHVDAKFTGGANNGKQMVLVPENTLTARLSWTSSNGQSADVGAQWVDSQRYGSDFDNTCSGKIPSYTTLDARYARKFGQWELALAGTNLSDKHYYSQAFTCDASGKSGIYPSDGRQLKVSARYEF